MSYATTMMHSFYTLFIFILILVITSGLLGADKSYVTHFTI